MTRPLTAKQHRALVACVDPDGFEGIRFWAAARANGRNSAGSRLTLDSLRRLGLVEYAEGWRATDKGRTYLQANP